MKQVKLNRIAPGHYMFKNGTREYYIDRQHDDRNRWNVTCLIDGQEQWADCTWGGLEDVREMIAADVPAS